jgi:hypothetical protein
MRNCSGGTPCFAKAISSRRFVKRFIGGAERSPMTHDALPRLNGGLRSAPPIPPELQWLSCR